METKLSQLKAKYASGDKIGALAIAAKFPRLGDFKDTVQMAWAAHQNPSFYTQIGHNPDALKEAGFKALEAMYGL